MYVTIRHLFKGQFFLGTVILPADLSIVAGIMLSALFTPFQLIFFFFFNMKGCGMYFLVNEKMHQQIKKMTLGYCNGENIYW